MVELLLGSRADINAADRLGRTALMKALDFGHDRTVKVLLDWKANARGGNRLRFVGKHVVKLLGDFLLTLLNFSPFSISSRLGGSKRFFLLSPSDGATRSVSRVFGADEVES